jgi:acyl-CoA dehydrogenase
VRDGDEWVINGSKTFISNGLNADLIVVVCKTDPAAGAKGVSLIMVEADRAGFRRGRKLEKVGQHAADTAELFFDDVRVPASNLIGVENRGFIHLMEELPQERLIIASTCGRLERQLELTLDYVKDRRLSTRPSGTSRTPSSSSPISRPRPSPSARWWTTTSASTWRAS